MGLFRKSTLEATISFPSHYSVDCDIYSPNGLAELSDYIALSILQFSKMLFIIPSNYLNTYFFIRSVQSICEKKPNHGIYMMETHNLKMTLMRGEFYPFPDKKRVYKTSIDRNKLMRWRINTKIPIVGGVSSQSLFTVLAIVDQLYSHLTKDQLHKMFSALELFCSELLKHEKITDKLVLALPKLVFQQILLAEK